MQDRNGDAEVKNGHVDTVGEREGRVGQIGIIEWTYIHYHG